MAKLLFRLRNVPDDELNDVHAILAEHDIAVYETDAGNWGISLPALWLQDDNQFEQARELIEQYQQERAAKAREEYQTLRQEGQADTWLASFKRQPFRVISFLALIVLVTYLSTSAFFF
jgi:hypothetical protein